VEQKDVPPAFESLIELLTFNFNHMCTRY